MEVIADRNGFKILSGGEEFFSFLPTVDVLLNGHYQDEERLSFHKMRNEYMWEYKCKEADKICRLKKVGAATVFSTIVSVKGKVGNVRWFNNSEFSTSGYYSQLVAPHGDVAGYKEMTLSEKDNSGFFAPAPLCLCFDMEGSDRMIGVGAVSKAGQYNYGGFSYNYEDGKISFSIDYNEYTDLEGDLELPDIVFFEGSDRGEILRRYSEFHYENGYLRNKEQKHEKWWNGPFFCGWGDQWIIGMEKFDSQDASWEAEATEDTAKTERQEKSVFDYAIEASTEREYKKMLEKADDKGIAYSAIIIDCKWQKKFGTMELDEKRWPKFRSFVDDMHKKGKKVLMWLNFWSGEGLPEDECMQVEDGSSVYVDPTNPKYQERLNEAMHKLLSSDKGCYDVDGFKIDFTTIITEKNIKTYEKGVYGIELVKRRAAGIYEAAKAVKPEALISTQHVHPYFEDVADMVRIGDYYGASNRAKSNLDRRVEIVKAVMPGILIDTDAPSGSNRRDSLLYFKTSVKRGVPSIYGIEIYNRLFSNDDWKTVKDLYDTYLLKINKQYDIKDDDKDKDKEKEKEKNQ